MADRTDRLAGLAFLAWAAALERTVAKKTTWEQRQKRRNAALIAAWNRGIQPSVMAAWLGMTPRRVKEIVDPPPEKPDGQAPDSAKPPA